MRVFSTMSPMRIAHVTPSDVPRRARELVGVVTVRACFLDTRETRNKCGWLVTTDGRRDSCLLSVGLARCAHTLLSVLK